MATPFDEVTFDQPAQEQPSINADDLNSTFQSLVNGNNSAFIPPSTPSNKPQQVQGGTQAGVDRVNQDTGNTGVVAYRDEKGQAVLTNVAKNPITGQDQPILLNKQAPGQQRGPDTPNAIFQAIAQLRKTNDIAAARGIYENLQQTLAQEQARLTTEAFTFAENKLNLPQLQKQLELSRQTDQASIGWYPGIGDSPITQKISAQIAQARAFADNEAKNYLSQNSSWTSLIAAQKSSDLEFKRIENIDNQVQQKLLTQQLTQENMQLRSQERQQEKQENQKDALLRTYDQLTAEQIARIQFLNQADFSGLSSITDEDTRKMKTAALAIGLGKNKNKDYQAAINAEGNQQLLVQSLQGNDYARKILIANESTATGIDPTQVDQQLKALQQALYDPKMVSEVLQARYAGDPKKAKELETELKMNMKSFDPNKKLDAGNQRMSMLFEWAQGQKNAKFMNDVGSWNTTDPELLAAIDKSRKVTGTASLENIIPAYVGNAEGPEFLQKLTNLKGLAEAAALKQKNSVFGAPDYMRARAIIDQHAIGSTVVGRYIQQFKKNFAAAIDPLNLSGQITYQPGEE